MTHPRMRKNARMAATIPSFSGGLNSSADAARIGDTELCDCRDMWWRDGALRTRDGFVTDDTCRSNLAFGDRTWYYTDRDGYLLVLSTEEYEASADLYVTVFDKDGKPTGSTFALTGQHGLHGFFVAVGQSPSLSRFTSLLFVSNGDIYGVNAARNAWESLENDLYEPLYMTNGKPVQTRAETTLTGDRAEPYNHLTEWFRCTYSTDGEGIYYYLPTLRPDSDLIVSLNGTLTFEMTYGKSVSATVGGYQVQFDRAAHCFWFVKDGKPCAVANDGLRQNVTARAQHGYMAGPEVTDMRFGTWYGGDRSATAGGTRLFLGGGSYVMWSTPENPLYLPVTAYASLGDPDEALTAFGKQGELLILFKEHSLYAAEYVRGDTITTDDVQSGAVTDITATAVFPITPVHAEIGCDLPETVALFGNRLVWACTDGNVYTLGTSGQLTQRTVTVISKAVRPLLRQATPKTAAGVVIDGAYWLLWDDLLLLATDDEAPRWTRFDFGKTGASAQGLCRVNGKLRIPAAYKVGGVPILFWYCMHGDTDTVLSHTGNHWTQAVYTCSQQAVRGMICTKQFDFGVPDEYKRILRVFADATAEGAVSASYVTERGETADVEHRATDGIRLTPNMVRCRRFALRLTGDGLRIGSVTLHVMTERK